MTFKEVMEYEYRAAGTLQAVADKCDITKSIAYKYVMGYSSPKVYNAIKVLNILGYCIKVKYNEDWVDFSANSFSNWLKIHVSKNSYNKIRWECEIAAKTMKSAMQGEVGKMYLSTIERILWRSGSDMDIVKI